MNKRVLNSTLINRWIGPSGVLVWDTFSSVVISAILDPLEALLTINSDGVKSGIGWAQLA